MGRAPCCDKANVKRGPWSAEEDSILKNYLEQFGNGGNWIALPKKAGLNRCGKSCRLRWLNYLRPDIKHGGFTKEEDTIICNLYCTMGSRWSVIASQLPGRTDNDVKNYWNTKLKKNVLAGKLSDNTQVSVSTIPEEFGNSSYYLSADSAAGMIFDPSANSNYGNKMTSTTQEAAAASSLSISSSSSTLENNYDLRSANGNVEDEGILLDDFDFEYSYELLNGFDFEKASNEVAQCLGG
ncbi:hypothetical protein CICLE_v10009336mg [Citrus x clementina]|uniref:Uncharacterized protein n=2 Tax=Citrus TaxID=2706 RepID=A0A067ELE3_CITSI|nr:hypothetical protein CICLE_v10009336mg [Citrus x clementina]KDO55908.1 hypothetical protein CISIN_1g037024mg [Citrus sinensis]